MRTPLPYNPSIFQKRNSLLGVSGTIETEETQLISQIRENFSRNLGYTKVIKNFENNVQYEACISEGDAKDKDVPFKRFLSYPYAIKQFSRGDYITFQYGQKQTTWLLKSLNEQFFYDLNGRIYICNNTLKWIDEFNKTISYPCVVQDQANRATFDFNNNIIIPDGTIFIDVQTNSDTEKIEINKRFILNKQAFKLNFVENITAGNITTLTLVKDNVASDDDLIEGIANKNQYNYSLSINQSNIEQSIGFTSQLTYTLTLNGDINTNAVEWISSNPSVCTVNSSGNIDLLSLGSATITCRMVNNNLISDSINISVVSVPVINKQNKIIPEIYSILQNESQTYIIYQYENGLPNGSEFSFAFSGASVNNYTAQIINGNQINITNKNYDVNKLTIIATNLVDGSVLNWQVQLKGLW
jgi:hypothetical protein